LRARATPFRRAKAGEGGERLRQQTVAVRQMAEDLEQRRDNRERVAREVQAGSAETVRERAAVEVDDNIGARPRALQMGGMNVSLRARAEAHDAQAARACPF